MPVDSDSLTRYEMICDKRRVRQILRQMVENRIPLNVSIPDTDDRYSTTLVDIDEYQHEIVIDGLRPASGNDRLLEARRLSVMGAMGGQEILFASRLVNSSQGAERLLLRISFPEWLRYLQQRGCHRVPVGSTVDAGLVLYDDGFERQVVGKLEDLSEEGLGVSFPEHLSVDVGDAAYPIILRLPDGDLITDVELRFKGQIEICRQTRVGARFVSLEPKQRAMIRRFVADLQRRMIRVRTHTGD